jgi:hypothetical protein
MKDMISEKKWSPRETRTQSVVNDFQNWELLSTQHTLKF